MTPGPRNGISVAGCTALSNLSAEPTYTAGQPKVLLEFNPRLFAQWTAYDLNAAIESIPFDENHFLIAHKILLVRSGIYMLEYLDLSALAADGVHEGIIAVSPLKVTGATGSPINPVFIA